MLILLDINGILCQKYDIKQEKIIEKECDKNNTLNTGKYIIVIRPEIQQFLKYCYKKYEVAFFSSTTEYNAKNILNSILTPEQLTHTKFFWYRDKAQLDLESDNKFDTVKNLSQVFTHTYINKNREYSEANTLIIDNEWKKVRNNNEKNVVIMSEYDIFSGSNLIAKEMIDIVKNATQNLK